MPRGRKPSAPPRYNGKHPGGRPRHYAVTPEGAAELARDIEDYFNDPTATTRYRSEMLKTGPRAGEVVKVPIRVVTWSGLCLFLRLDEQRMDEMQQCEEFRESITRARARIVEEALAAAAVGEHNPLIAKMHLGAMRPDLYRDRAEISGSVTLVRDSMRILDERDGGGGDGVGAGTDAAGDSAQS
jgi:DNA-binding PadR family transcriptional regulator